MHNKPHQPCDQPREPKRAYIYNSVGASNSSQISLVRIMKRLTLLLAVNALCDDRGNIMAFLDRCWGYARHRFAMLLYAGGISNHKDVRVTRNAQVTCYFDTSRSIRFSIEPLSGRRCPYARTPDDGIRRDVFA